MTSGSYWSTAFCSHSLWTSKTVAKRKPFLFVNFTNKISFFVETRLLSPLITKIVLSSSPFWSQNLLSFRKSLSCFAKFSPFKKVDFSKNSEKVEKMKIFGNFHFLSASGGLLFLHKLFRLILSNFGNLGFFQNFP